MLERATILAGEGLIRMEHLPINFATSLRVPIAPPPSGAVRQDSARTVVVEIGTTVGEAEKSLILRTLEHTGNNKTRAAEILGISLKTLHNKLKEYAGDGE
jgi:DNA-binding NtrC family response regulator